jgi:hypothetical protein
MTLSPKGTFCEESYTDAGKGAGGLEQQDYSAIGAEPILRSRRILLFTT